MAMAMTQPPMSGLAGLMNFTDNLQEADTGLDRIALLRQMQQPPMIQREVGGMVNQNTLPGLKAMERVRSELEEQIDLAGLQELMMDQEEEPLNQEDYIQYAASGGLVGLPIVQAGFGKFISRAFKSIAKPISRAVKSIGKSKLGRIALAAAPMMFGLPPWQVALISGGLTKAGGGSWGDALKAGALAYGGSKLAQGFKGVPGGAEGYASTAASRADQLAQATQGAAKIGSHAAGTGTAATSVWKDLAQSVLGGPEGAVYNPTGTFVSRLGERLADTGQFADTTWKQELGLQSLPEAGGQPAPVAQADQVSRVGPDRITDKGFSVDPSTTASVSQDPSLVRKVWDKIPMSAKIGGGATLLTSLMGGKGEEEIDPSIAGLGRERVVDTDFDKQSFQYYRTNPDTGEREKVDTDTALGLIAEAYRNYDPEDKDVVGVTTGFTGVKSGGPIQLSNNGGLIGMAYGGEFAGQVGGRGHGMEDNVYMPIIEKRAGEQIGTLAVSPDEYVVDSYTMSLLGNGSPDAGAQVMDKTIKDIRLRATGQPNQQREIDGLEALNRMRGI